jgi:ABC-type amino acid transport substrate-binding protein
MRMMAADVGRMQSIIEQYTAKTGESVGVSAKSMVEAVQNNQIEAVATERPFLQHIFTQAESLSQVIVALDWQILIAPFGTGFMLSDSPVVVVPPRGVNAV